MVTATRSRSKPSRKPTKKPAWEIQVNLVVRGFDEDPDEISKLLRIRPSNTWRRGDLASPPAAVRWNDNGWELSAAVGSAELTKYIEKLVSRTDPIRARLGRLPEKAEVSVFCGILDYDRRVDLSLSKKAIQGLARLGVELEIDYYDLSNTDE